MTWHDVISCQKIATLRPGGPPFATHLLAEIEMALSLTLPADLRSLLSEMDGIYDTGGYFHLIMPAADILATNRSFRESPDYRAIFQPFDSLLFFGQAGNGDLFAYPVLTGGIPGDAIIAWDHEDDRRREVAPSLCAFIEGWITDEIRL